jgi:hypothetical protein
LKAAREANAAAREIAFHLRQKNAAQKHLFARHLFAA